MIAQQCYNHINVSLTKDQTWLVHAGFSCTTCRVCLSYWKLLVGRAEMPEEMPSAPPRPYRSDARPDWLSRSKRSRYHAWPQASRSSRVLTTQHWYQTVAFRFMCRVCAQIRPTDDKSQVQRELLMQSREAVWENQIKSRLTLWKRVCMWLNDNKS